MKNDTINAESLFSIWKKNGAWDISYLISELRSRILKKYPVPDSSENAQNPSDPDSIGKNIVYLFPSHIMKIQKALCTTMADKESLDYFSQIGNITVLDLACGPGTASFAFVDFILGLLRNAYIKRASPLQITIIFQDLEVNCLQAAEYHTNVLRNILSQYGNWLRISVGDTFRCSISETINLMNNSHIQTFDLMFLANALDPILIHGHKALELIPDCQDPIAHARPCDRPALLGNFLNNLGKYANPYYSRDLLLQENRYAPLIPICLPSQELKVIRTSMTQKTIRPDYSSETMIVPFAYCGYKYSFSNKAISNYPIPQPLACLENFANCFGENDYYESIPELLLLDAVCRRFAVG